MSQDTERATRLIKLAQCTVLTEAEAQDLIDIVEKLNRESIANQINFETTLKRVEQLEKELEGEKAKKRILC